MIKKFSFIAFTTAVSAFAATWTGQISDSACGMNLTAKSTHISNQNLGALKTNAGETVELTRTMKGDTITVSKIAKK